jgi:hypothetical protein
MVSKCPPVEINNRTSFLKGLWTRWKMELPRLLFSLINLFVIHFTMSWWRFLERFHWTFSKKKKLLTFESFFLSVTFQGWFHCFPICRAGSFRTYSRRFSAWLLFSVHPSAFPTGGFPRLTTDRVLCLTSYSRLAFGIPCSQSTCLDVPSSSFLVSCLILWFWNYYYYYFFWFN